MKVNEYKQVEIQGISNKNMYFSIIESLLFVSGNPLKIEAITSILGLTNKQVRLLMLELTLKYEDDNRGIKLLCIDGEYQLVTKEQNSEYIRKLLNINTRQSLSQASLETLAIIAYKQPITRVEIDEIRGVKSEGALNTLINKKLIKECGKKDAPGKPNLYSTTQEFLRHFGLSDIKDLISLKSLEELEELEENLNIKEIITNNEE